MGQAWSNIRKEWPNIRRAIIRFFRKYILCQPDKEDLIDDENEEAIADTTETPPGSPGRAESPEASKSPEKPKAKKKSEKKDLDDQLKGVSEMFDYYSAFAGDKKGEISLRAIDKWFDHAGFFKETGVFKGKKIGKDDTAVIFAKTARFVTFCFTFHLILQGNLTNCH